MQPLLPLYFLLGFSLASLAKYAFAFGLLIAAGLLLAAFVFMLKDYLS